MTEIEILSKALETVGIGGTILILSAVLIYKGMGIYSKRAEQMTLIENKTLDNARAERETTYKAQSELTQAVKYLADKTESVGKSQEETTRILATLKGENQNAIDATKSAESNILNTLSESHKAQTESIKSLNALILELQHLIKLNPTSDALNTRLDAIVEAFNTAILKLENRLINELTRIKLHETQTIATVVPNAISDTFDTSPNSNPHTAGID